MKTIQTITVNESQVKYANEVVNRIFSIELKIGTVKRINENTWQEISRGGLFGSVNSELTKASINIDNIETIHE